MQKSWVQLDMLLMLRWEHAKHEKIVDQCRCEALFSAVLQGRTQGW